MRLLALLLAALLLVLSAPRSAPENAGVSGTVVVSDHALPRWPDDQGRTGAPTLGREAVVRGTSHGSPRRNEGSSPLGAPLFARTGIGSAAFGGLATWFAWPGFTAAAGPTLRAAGVRPGDYLTVRHTAKVRQLDGTVKLEHRSIVVRVIRGGCWCPDRNGRPVLLDLSRLAFSRLAAPSAGVIVVIVEVGVRQPRLPATSTEEGWKP